MTESNGTEDSNVKASLQNSLTVRPELVEGQKLTQEFIEGHGPSIHPSMVRQAHDSGRTDGDALDDGNKL